MADRNLITDRMADGSQNIAMKAEKLKHCKRLVTTSNYCFRVKHKDELWVSLIFAVILSA